MTYEKFDELISQAAAENKYDLFFWICHKYPEMCEEFDRRVEEECKDLVETEETKAETQASWERLCEKLREKYGEDFI